MLGSWGSNASVLQGDLSDALQGPLQYACLCLSGVAWAGGLWLGELQVSDRDRQLWKAGDLREALTQAGQGIWLEW